MARLIRLPVSGDATQDLVAEQEPLGVLLAPARWDRKIRSPELRKAFGSIQAAAAEARRLLTLPEEDAPLRTEEVIRMLRDFLAQRPEKLEIEPAWNLAASLEALLPMLGDYSYVQSLLEMEAVRAHSEAPQSWSSYFELEQLEQLRHEYRTSTPNLSAHRIAVNHLSLLNSFRAADQRSERAKAGQKTRFFNVVAPMLLSFLFFLGFVVDEIAPDETKSLLLAAAAGALGGVLGGLLRLRDKPIQDADLRAFWPVARLQPLIGATAGVIIFLILESGLLSSVIAQNTGTESATRSWASDALLAFIAGFSEPFFLGLVRRIGGLDTEESSKG